MKKLIVILIVICCENILGQQILNGDMEQWDTLTSPYPESWLTNAFYASLPCTPAVVTAESTSDTHSGMHAVKLEAKGCADDMFLQQVYVGILAYGNLNVNNNNPNLAHGIYYTQRPQQLTFYYKFNKVGTDTGFAKVVLRLLDSVGHAGQIIGEGKVSIINNTSIYTPLTIPINYLLPDAPEIIQIVFSTSKTIADHEYFPLNTSPNHGANIGSTLWIDDVSVSGGTIGLTEYKKNNHSVIFPNPVHNVGTLTFENPKNENQTLKIFNGQGQITKTINNIITSPLIIDVTDLAVGLYFFQLKTNEQLISTGKFVVE